MVVIMAQSISGSNIISANTRGVVRPKVDVLAQEYREQIGDRKLNKSETMYLKKRSAFENRNAIQKKIDNRIEDQNWVKNLSYEKELYVVFGYYFNKNMAMLSRAIVEDNAQYVDRF